MTKAKMKSGMVIGAFALTVGLAAKEKPAFVAPLIVLGLGCVPMAGILLAEDKDTPQPPAPPKIG